MGKCYNLLAEVQRQEKVAPYLTEDGEEGLVQKVELKRLWEQTEDVKLKPEAEVNNLRELRKKSEQLQAWAKGAQQRRESATWMFYQSTETSGGVC